MLKRLSNLFGTFLKSKRVQKSMPLRELAEKASIAHSYLSKIEEGLKPPPSDNVIKQLSKSLSLNEEETIIFYDLAAKCKKAKDSKNNYLPIDIAEYICETERAKEVIRQANKQQSSNDFWNELLNKR